jgi:hypothetical protein
MRASPHVAVEARDNTVRLPRHDVRVREVRSHSHRCHIERPNDLVQPRLASAWIAAADVRLFPVRNSFPGQLGFKSVSPAGPDLCRLADTSGL